MYIGDCQDEIFRDVGAHAVTRTGFGDESREKEEEMGEEYAGG